MPSKNNSDLQAALDILGTLKQKVATTDALTNFAKKENELRITWLQEELQKPKPDQNFVNDLIHALTQGLSQVSALANLVTQVAKLLAKPLE